MAPMINETIVQIISLSSIVLREINDYSPVVINNYSIINLLNLLKNNAHGVTSLCHLLHPPTVNIQLTNHSLANPPHPLSPHFT